MKLLIALSVCISLLCACDKLDKKSEKLEQKHFEIIDKSIDGNISIIDQSKGRLIVINKSNRIYDVIDLDLQSEEITKIKNEKATQDAAIKIKDWGTNPIANSKYFVTLSTRYYKDKLLYKILFSPADSSTPAKARFTFYNLRDQSGFIIEKISPQSNWVTIIDEKGNPTVEQASGEIPITLDSYLEISSYDPTWSFK